MYIEVMLAPNRGDGADVFEDSELEDMGRMGSASVKTFRGLVRLLGPVWLESCANTLFLRAGLVPTAKRVQIETILTNILNMMWNCGSNRWVRPLVFSKTRADPPILLFRWAHSRTPKKGSSKTRLYEILDNAQYKGQKLTYLYDYGDCWQHKIEVVGRAAATEKVRCTDGDGHHIAEVSIVGYKHLPFLRHTDGYAHHYIRMRDASRAGRAFQRPIGARGPTRSRKTSGTGLRPGPATAIQQA